MLARLGIRQKLVALAALPMIAVLLTIAPFITERVRDASLATATADAAQTARSVGDLIQDLQQERLLALAFMSSTQVDRTAVVARMATSEADAARLRGQPGTGPVLQRVDRSLASLAATRSLFVGRTVSAQTAYQTYRRAISDLITELRLTNPAGVDVDGIRQLQTLDELTRANEEAASLGATLVAVAGDPKFPVGLVDEAATAQAQHTSRLSTLVNIEQAQLLDLLEGGKAGDRINLLVATVDNSAPGASVVTVADALSAAASWTNLRQVGQDRISRDVVVAATSRAVTAQRVAVAAGLAGLVLLVLVFWLARTISRSISRPLRQLTRAATDVAVLAERQLVRIADADADDDTPIQLADVDIASPDEIGELAAAFNRVQSTAAGLLIQQASSRRNVAVMFANIARRTQNLVGRQRTQLQALRRYISDPQALEQLARLDQQRSQLRRSADSLLVVSGIVDQGIGGAPTLLSDIITVVCTDLGALRRVRVQMVVPVAVTAGLVEDLRLVLGELLANALNFSPPEVPVELTAQLHAALTITIVDHGLGLTEARLEEENRRLLGRERLDVAPTSVLGLFVVGRLARRHALAVQLEHTAGGGITVRLDVPPALLGPATVVDVIRRPAMPGTPALLSAGERGINFDWFGPAARTAELPALPPSWPPLALPPTSETPMLAPPAPAALPAAPLPAIPAQHVVPSQPAQLGPPAGYGMAASVPAAAAPPAAGSAAGGNGAGSNGGPPDERRAGLTRRRPGQHMAQGLKAAPSVREPARERRDPLAERAQLDSLLAGFARGETSQHPPVRSEPPVERPL